MYGIERFQLSLYVYCLISCELSNFEDEILFQGGRNVTPDFSNSER